VRRLPAVVGLNALAGLASAGNSASTTHAVGEKLANAWGLYDIYGNIWEWCGDWYGDYPGGNVADPKGPSTGAARVLRGGSWSYDAAYCRSAGRYGSRPDYRYNSFGFRVVLAPGQP
jgi:formylglycine-generating enzyme required for sulfatase activity